MVSRRTTRGPEAPRLTDFIHQRREEILAAWKSRVRALPAATKLDEPALLDHVPALLERIAQSANELVSGGVAQPPISLAELHALHRLSEGFDLNQVITEFAILRDIVTKLWEQNLLDVTHRHELRVLNRAIDTAISASAERFTAARDRTLHAFEKISSAASGTRNLDQLLERLLRVLMQTSKVIETIAILIRDADTLRLRATAGLETLIPKEFSVRLGEGFLGSIAQDGQARALKAGASDPLFEKTRLSSAGVRVVHGVPLFDNGDTIGVAFMGSLSVDTFPGEDTRLFSAMANRASHAIYQYILREQGERTATVLRESEARFRTLADNVPEIVWMADGAANVFWYNARWTELTGVTVPRLERADGACWSWESLIHPDHAERVSIKSRHALATSEPWEDTFPLLARDGRYRWFLFRVAPIRDNGHIGRWLGTGTDVTTVRYLDEVTKVLASSLDYGATLERVAGLVVPDLADWCIIDILERGGELRRVGIATSDPTKEAWAHDWIRKHPANPTASRGIYHAIETGEPEFFPIMSDEILAQNANLRELSEHGLRSVIIAPLNARGRTLGTITLLRMGSGRRYDHSDVERAKELGTRAGLCVDNARLYQEAQRAVRLREDVLAIVSHDLRNPLGAIDLSASMLLQSYGSDARARNQIEVIRRSVGRMEHMINDLLDMASIQAGRLSLKRQLEDARSLIEEAIDAHAPLAQERGIHIERDIALDNVELDCDRDRVAQVFGNLLGNALKFCRRGDVISIRAFREANHARFDIRDTGPGIAEEDLPHIFEPYWSARREQAKGSRSTGLGLHICKAIVEAHGGTLRVESELGQGATFSIALPIARIDA
ncbi:MAG: hypothetical protein JWO36_6651 [Myxococcales bacterium]|nr:hypothetical protein [Myxococcales bacterium]